MAAETELHFGATVPDDDAGTAAQARLMESLGYEYVGLGEHFVRGNPPAPSHAALPLLGVAAGATEKIRLLSAVLLAPFYHPTVLAKMATGLDIASGGRLTLGLGIGGEFPVEFEAVGLDVKQRGRRSDECLEALRRLWTEQHVTYHGRHFHLNDVTLNPPPTQRPHPPVWVAGRREAAMVRAARHGEGWFPYFYSPDRYHDSVEKTLGFAAEIGRDLAGFQWAFFSYISIYPTVEEAEAVSARILGSQYLYGGDFSDIVRRYCILGPVDRCIARLQEYVDAGVRYFIFNFSCPKEERSRHLETVAREVIPGLRESAGLA